MNRTTAIVVASLFVGAFTSPYLLNSPRAAHGAALSKATPLPEQFVEQFVEQVEQQDKLESETGARGVDSIRITPVVRAVQKAGPSVVSIQVGELRNTFEGVGFRKLGDGSGVIVSAEGLVLTNWHVVRFKDRVRSFAVRIALRDGRRMPADVVSVSRENDLALLRIKPDDGREHRFPPISMGESSTLMVGETVIAIGNPRGQENTVTTGVLSAVNRSLTVTPIGERRPIEFKELLQTDAAINPGNSGGALLDITGKLIGINTLMQLESQNIGYAIPVDHVRSVFEDTLLDVDQFLWTGLEVGEERAGLVVTHVVSGSPAAVARIARGDRILQVGDHAVKSRSDFAKRIVAYSPGQRVPLYVDSRGTPAWREVVGWNKNAAMTFQLAGLAVEELDARASSTLYQSVRQSLWETYRYDRGVDMLRATEIQPDGPAAELGLRSGDLIVGFIDRGYFVPLTNGTTELADVLAQSRGARSPLLSVYRPGDGLLRGRVLVRDR